MSQSWNFARRPFRDDRPLYAAAVVLLVIGAAVLVANLRLVGQYRRGVADTREAIATLEARGQRADEKASAAKKDLSSYRLSTLADESRGLATVAAERKFSWTTLLARLEKTLPGSVGVTRLQPQFDTAGNVSLDMQLVARGREALVPTIAALARDPAFEEIDLKSETIGEPGSIDPFVFTLTMQYRPEAVR
jgi:Tfp pilus assembly protein PilN